jgi:hypothetical protein
VAQSKIPTPHGKAHSTASPCRHLIALRQRAVAHHIGEHDGSEFAVFGAVAHFSKFILLSNSTKRGSLRTLSK